MALEARKRAATATYGRSRSSILSPGSQPIVYIEPNPDGTCTLPKPPPAPTVDQAVESPFVGQSAVFALNDAAGADQGSLSWHVTSNDHTKIPFTLTQKVTSTGNHQNALTIATDSTTKPGVYSLSATVTSKRSGLSSTSTPLSLRVLISTTFTGQQNVEVGGVKTGPYSMAESYIDDPSATADVDAYDDGSSNVASVDSTVLGPFAGPSTAIVPHPATKRVRPQSTFGSFQTYVCKVSADMNATMGLIKVDNLKVSCESPAKVYAVGLVLFQRGVNRDYVSPKTGIIALCAAVSNNCSAHSTSLAIGGGTGVYVVEAIPIVFDAIPIYPGLLAQQFPYNDGNEPYPSVFPYGSAAKMIFPAPPFDDCRQKEGTDGCPVGSSRTLRIAMIDAYWGAGTPNLIPPGVTKKSSPNYRSHHIKPTSCGGDNKAANGAFLDNKTHQTTVNNWWRKFSPCGMNGTLN